MYETCPKCGHRRDAGDDTPTDRCPACGILFEKWLRAQLRAGMPAPQEARDLARDAGQHLAGAAEGARGMLLAIPERVDGLGLAARAVLLLGLAIWGGWFISTDWAAESGPFRAVSESFMHRVNLVFHEAGHVLFALLGDFIGVLGGSLGQLLMPLVVMLVFLLRQRDPFGASVGLWWLAQSLMDLAPYIGDARRGELLLLGGVTGSDAPGHHDWRNLLGRLGLLHRDRDYAGGGDALGELLMVLAIAWGAALLWRQWRRLSSR